MRRVWSQFLGVFLIVVVAGTGIYTNAFFSDIEQSLSNLFAATNLDGALEGESLSDAICLLSGEAETELLVSNEGALPFTYDFAIENATGTACGELEIEIFRDNILEFDGLIADLLFSGFMLGSSEDDTWRVKVKFPFETSGSCTFDTFVSAYQDGFMSGEAYYDTERTTHTVSVDTGEACGPTVFLHLSKAISGDNQGFEFSDFSYRVTGGGFDTIVPHNGTIALPEGTYMIEELVPEGFVKEDWRIGWYGACERGSTYTTTITIDDGNIDHGTLYCQADNQYRPENNDSEEVAAETTSSESTSEPRREQRTSRSSTQEPDPAETVAGTSTTAEATTSTTSGNGAGADAEGDADAGADSAEGTDGADGTGGIDGTDGADGTSSSSTATGDTTEETSITNEAPGEDTEPGPEEETDTQEG